MKLDQYQRTVLANQYRILEKLDPDGGWDQKREVIESGYEGEYDLGDSETLSAEEGNEVGDILTVFRVLKYSYRDLSTDEKDGIDPADVRFAGFDANDRKECKYLGYTRFLWKTGRFTESRDDDHDGGNSHMEMLGSYRRMVAAYRRCVVQGKLTRADVLAIIDARSVGRLGEPNQRP